MPRTSRPRWDEEEDLDNTQPSTSTSAKPSKGRDGPSKKSTKGKKGVKFEEADDPQAGEEDYEEDEYYDDYDYGERAGRAKTDLFDPGGSTPDDPLAFLRTRYGGRKKRAMGPQSWQDVDEAALVEEAELLSAAVSRGGANNDKGAVLNQIFSSGVAQGSKEVLDPMGFGAIDLARMALVEEGTTTKALDAEQHGQVINKWHRAKGDKAGDGKGADGAHAGAETSKQTNSALPPELAPLLPTEELFSPELYLGTFHQDDSEAMLRKGSKALSRELKERTGQLKQLVRENFDRFTSCKSTIDDIYAKLRKVEGFGSAGTADSSAHAGAGGASTELLQRAMEGVQSNAKRTFGAILDRANKTDRIKSVANLLHRFQNLFGMPSRIKMLAQEGDLHQVVAEYRRANALIRPTPITARVWVSLYQEIEKRVIEVSSGARDMLEETGSGAHEDIPDAIIFLAQLAAERLPGTRDEDAMRLYLDLVEHQLIEEMEMLDEEHLHRMAELQERLGKDSTARTAALEAAAALDPNLQSSQHLAAGSDGTASATPAGNSAHPSAGGAHQARSHAGSADPSRPVETMAGPPRLPASLEDVALLLWPGPSDWDEKRELPPAMAANLEQRRMITVPRSSYLPEVSVPPAQASWVTYAAALSDTLVAILPGLWAVATSKKYAQATDVPDAVRESMSKAPSLARRLVDVVLMQYNTRLQVALQTLSYVGGPVAPLVQIVVQDLCRTWVELRDGGTTSKALDGVRAGVLGGLALYAASAQSHLSALPRMLMDNDDWMLDLTLLDQQPVTSIPRLLQEEVGAVMLHFGALAISCEDVDPSGVAAAWLPLRDGLFSCFAAFTTCVAGFTSELQSRIRAAQKAAHAGPRMLNKTISMRRSDSESSSAEVMGSDSLQAAEEELFMQPMASGPLDDILAAARLSSGHTKEHDEDADALERNGGSVILAQGGSAPQRLPVSPSAAAARGASAAVPLTDADDVRMLNVISNATWMRTRVFPALVDRYYARLAGASADGESKCDALLKARGSESKKAASALLSVYLERKEQAMAARISAFVRLVAAPGGASPKLQGVSDAAMAVVLSMVDIHIEVAAYLPGSLKAVIASLVEHTVVGVLSKLHELGPTADAASVLQLHADLMFIDYVWQNQLPASVRSDVDDMYGQLQSLLLKALIPRKSAKAQAVPQALHGLAELARGSREQFDEAVAALCKAAVLPTIDRTAHNIMCFTAA